MAIHRWMVQVYNADGEFVLTEHEYTFAEEARTDAKEVYSAANQVCFVYFYNEGTPHSASFVTAFINGVEVKNQDKRKY